MDKYKKLYLVRHGKAINRNSIIKDHDRTLAEQGIANNYMIAEKLTAGEHIPQMIISSPAIRAFHTALIFARSFSYPFEEIVINEDIYLHMEDEAKIREIIAETENSIESLMLFGHNSSFENLANYFLTDKINGLPKSGVVYLKFECASWNNISSFKPVEFFVDYPGKVQ